MKASLSSFILLSALHNGAIAQNTLEPCANDITDAYHAGVNRTVNDAVMQPSSLQLTTVPSFQPESGVRLVGTELYFVEFRSSFWGDSYYVDRVGSGRMDFARPRVVTRTRHAPIGEKAAHRVEKVYSMAIAKAQKSDRRGLDGVTYFFATSDGTCGWTWSPEPSSRNGRLVKLVKHLEKHAALSRSIDLQRSERVILRLVQRIEGEWR